jgi:hypothetical protein
MKSVCRMRSSCFMRLPALHIRLIRARARARARAHNARARIRDIPVVNHNAYILILTIL